MPRKGRKAFRKNAIFRPGQEDKECHPHAKLDTQMKFNMATQKSSLDPCATPSTLFLSTYIYMYTWRLFSLCNVTTWLASRNPHQRLQHKTDSPERILYGKRPSAIDDPPTFHSWMVALFGDTRRLVHSFSLSLSLSLSLHFVFSLLFESRAMSWLCRLQFHFFRHIFQTDAANGPAVVAPFFPSPPFFYC